jgi:hypothetical protein
MSWALFGMLPACLTAGERGLPRISKSLLAQRLRSLEQAGMIERHEPEHGRGSEYVPTQAGQELYDVIERLGIWGARWVNHDIGPDDADPDLLIWDMHRRINLDLAPDRRIVIQFDLSGMFTRSYWLVIERGDVSVCYSDLGFEADLTVTADTLALHRIWIGHRTFAAALRSGEVQLSGPRELVRGFPTWFQLSVFAHVNPVPRTLTEVPAG